MNVAVLVGERRKQADQSSRLSGSFVAWSKPAACAIRLVRSVKSDQWLLTIQFSLPRVLDNNRKYIDGAEIFLSGRIWVKRLITSVT